VCVSHSELISVEEFSLTHHFKYMKMKKETMIILLLTLICQTVFAQSKDIEIISNLNKDWLDSYVKKDSATLNRIFAPDFVLISPTGSKMTKKSIIDNLQNLETVSVNLDSVDVKLLTADVGVVTAYTTFVLNIDGKDVAGKNCYQDVYVKRKGRWVAVTAHVTLLNFK
jgi:hypothetical protein